MAIRVLLVCILAVLSLAGCNSVPTPGAEPASSATAPNMATQLPPPTYTSVSGNAYHLGPLDTVNVLVFQVPELSGDFQVGSDGNLGFPLIGNVRAAGRTAEDVQRDITTKLKASYLQQPQVTVKVTGFNSQKVTVDGAVNKPGSFAVMSTGGTLLEYIAAAGGLPRTADRTDVVIFRRVGEKRMVARFDVAAIRAGKLSDPAVYGGDTIVVAESGIRTAWQDFLTAVPLASFVATASGL